MSLPQATRLLPGLALCLFVAACAYAGAELLHRTFGAASVEPLVLAILIVVGWFLFTGPLAGLGGARDVNVNVNPPKVEQPAQPPAQPSNPKP